MSKKPVATIVGVGLIGGSLGLAWRKAGAAHVIGVARRPQVVETALAAGAIDEGSTDMAQAVAAADVVVFCTPVLDIIAIAVEAAASARPGTIFTDVGSTKQIICESLWQKLPENVAFIGGHPMAGSEKTGVGAADPYLFENAVYCLTPPQHYSPEKLDVLLRLVEAAGARPLVVDPVTHDMIVASVSHVPHLVAVALMRAVAATDAEMPVLHLAAGGLRDTTRVAGGPSDVWRDICLTNRQAILPMLDKFKAALQELYAAVEAADATALQAQFDHARAMRQSIPARSRAIMGTLAEVTLILPDKPGAIHAISGLCAAENINIVDLEILRVREGEGGTVRLSFMENEAADRVVALLRANGYTARRL